MKKTFRQSSALFIGMLILLIIANGYNYLLGQVISIDKVTSFGKAITENFPFQNQPEGFSALFFISTLLILPAVVFLMLLLLGNFRRGLFFFFPIQIAILGVVSYLEHIHAPLLEDPLFSTSFQLWGAFSGLLMVLFVFGFANQEYTFKTASLQYPILFFFSGVMSFLLPHWIQNKHIAKELVLPIMTIGSFVAFLVYIWMQKKDLGEKEPGHPFSWKYLFAYSLTVFAMTYTVVVATFGLITLEITKAEMVVKDLESWFLMFAGVGLLLGPVLYCFKKESFAKILGFLTFGIAAAMGTLFYFLQTNPKAAQNYDVFLLSQKALVFGTIIFYIMKELAFFFFPLQSRFRSKLLIDLFVIPFGSLTAIITSIYIANWFGKDPLSFSGYVLFSSIGVFFTFFGIFLLGRRIKKMAQPEQSS